MNVYKDAFVIAAISLSIFTSADGTGCPEPVVRLAEIAFSDSPGEDGLYPRDTFISVQCKMGLSMKGEQIVRCLKTDTWDTLPTCTRTGNIKCPPPPKPWGGEIKRIGSRRAMVSCNEGFKLHGKRKIVCAMVNGVPKWPRSVCRARNRCSNPGNVTDGDWTLLLADDSSSRGSQFSPNTKIGITCRTGFRLVGEPEVTCEFDGRWNPTLPTCEEIRCPALNESIPHGHSGMGNRTFKQGDVVDYFCDSGYRIFGKTFRVCSVDSPNGTWSDLNPVCTEILCPHPGGIQYGDYFLASNKIGGNVTFYCRSGYQIKGSATRHCLPSGKWSGELTTCDHDNFDCPNPGIPIGGFMENQETADFRRGSVVRYACSRNRVLVGSAERHCNNSGRWSGETPTCQSPFDFDDINEVAERIGYVADSLAIDTTKKTSGSKGRSINIAYEGGYHIYFAFDASGSIPEEHFETALDFAKTLVEKIGVNNAEYAACIYASEPVPSLLISDRQNSLQEVLNGIDALAVLRGSDEIKTGTATGKALRFIHTDLIPLADAHLQRSNAKRVLFLFTDGHTNEGASEATPKEEAEILREDYKVQIHCIGVTHEVDISELQDIASKPLQEHLFLIADFRELNQLVQAITYQQLDYSNCGYNGGPQRAIQTKGRIAGGVQAPLYEWPWQVALFKDKFGELKFLCGGTLIAPNWVLTAAHCFENLAWFEIHVYTGLNDKRLLTPDAKYLIDGEDGLKNHPSFSISSYANDIALVRLTRHAPLSPEVRTICMPQKDMTDSSLYSLLGELPYVTGWGVTEPYEITKTPDDKCDHSTDKTSTDLLQQLQIPLVSNAECDTSFEDKAYLCNTLLDFKHNQSFCAGSLEGGVDACKGDSGGPVMRELLMSDGSKRWVQIGIVSWGEGCAQEGRYGFYTRLSRYIGWIQEHVGDSILI